MTFISLCQCSNESIDEVSWITKHAYHWDCADKLCQSPDTLDLAKSFDAIPVLDGHSITYIVYFKYLPLINFHLGSIPHCSILRCNSRENMFNHFGLTLNASNLPNQVKTQYLHFRFHTNYFLLPWQIPEEISRRFALP